MCRVCALGSLGVDSDVSRDMQCWPEEAHGCLPYVMRQVRITRSTFSMSRRAGVLLLLAAAPVEAFLPSSCPAASPRASAVVQPPLRGLKMSSSVTQPGMPPARTKSLWDPVVYEGPVPAGGVVEGVEAAAVLEEYNLVLEVSHREGRQRAGRQADGKRRSRQRQTG